MKLAAFKKTYGVLHTACDLAEKMAGPDGQPKKLSTEYVDRLQKLCREAFTRANSITGTHDGREEDNGD